MRTPRRFRTLLVVTSLLGGLLTVAIGGAAAVPRQTTPPSTTPSTATPSTTATTAPTVPATVPGAKKKLLIVGDSVIKGVEVYGQLPALQAALPGYDITFDASESRSTVAGAGVILAHNPAQFDTVVVSLGTNDAGSPTVFTGRVTTVLEELKAVPHVYWMTVHEKGRYAKEYTASNAALALVAGKYPNTQVIDWNAFANTLPPTELAGDGLHLSQTSAQAMVGLIAASVLGTSKYAHSTAPTTTVPPTSAAVSTAAPVTTEGGGGSGSSSNGLLIGVVVGAVLVLGFVGAGIAGWRRSKARRRDERKARLDALFSPEPVSAGAAPGPASAGAEFTEPVAGLDGVPEAAAMPSDVEPLPPLDAEPPAEGPVEDEWLPPLELPPRPSVPPMFVPEPPAQATDGSGVDAPEVEGPGIEGRAD